MVPLVHPICSRIERMYRIAFEIQSKTLVHQQLRVSHMPSVVLDMGFTGVTEA